VLENRSWNAASNTKCFGGTAKASEECSEGFGQVQECSPVVGLIGESPEVLLRGSAAIADKLGLGWRSHRSLR